MYRPRFSIGQFNGDWDLAHSIRALTHCMNCLIEINIDYLRENPYAPKLYTSGVYYKRVVEAHNGDDDWADIPTCLTLKYGDCEDLAAWRIAELRLSRVFAEPGIMSRETHDGGRMYHAFVKLPGGRVEDPSAVVDYYGYFAASLSEAAE